MRQRRLSAPSTSIRSLDVGERKRFTESPSGYTRSYSSRSLDIDETDQFMQPPLGRRRSNTMHDISETTTDSPQSHSYFSGFSSPFSSPFRKNKMSVASRTSLDGSVSTHSAGYFSPISRYFRKHSDLEGTEVRVESALATALDSELPVSLEGTLSFRKSKALRQSKQWRTCYVVLHLADGGSLACYNEKPASFHASSKEELRRRELSHYSRDMSSNSLSNPDILDDPDITERVINADFNLPNYVNWVAKDIEHNHDGFVIEIPSSEPILPFVPMQEGGEDSYDIIDQERMTVPEGLLADLNAAKDLEQPIRFYFKCTKSGNEKLLWLQAFEQVNRLSCELLRKGGLKHFFRNPKLQISHSRIRSKINETFAEEGKLLDDDDSLSSVHDPGSALLERKKHGDGAKEYLTYPTYAYPNRWMTHRELYAEMLKPSAQFHDLRIPNPAQKEIGLLKVEVLQCVGLPTLDFASETDAVVYLVCGSYAFSSDVIWNRLNPMWLPRSRRACTFPLFHGYARLYAGVFDDDGKGEKDDFVGRVVLDLARLRPRSTYDVTMPLRLSNQVYTRRSRGSIRLRFSLEWHSERAAILSYIPKSFKPPIGPCRPDDDVTILCADEKAFRNIATTVHTVHMPGRFSFSQWRATMRESNFARKVAINVVRKLIMDIIKWQNPKLSFLVFCAWMHCIYSNAFSLVPFYFTAFLLLMMIRSYAIFGSDGPIQQGFIPPSFEELCRALTTIKESKVIEPLKVKPNKDSLRTYKSARITEPGEPETHEQSFKWLFQLLGFPNEFEEAEPEDYHLEFPFSQGLNYPKFTVKESMVSKASQKRRKKTDDDSLLGDLPGSSRRIEEVMRNESTKKDAEEIDFDELPPHLRIPDQNMDAKGPAKKKKLVDELYELRDNMHKLTFHFFNERTHVVKHKNAVYFGSAQKAVTSKKKRKGDINYELDRLLNTGQFSSGNPVVARVGTYMEPIIQAAGSGLCATRAVYNLLTWRDPILSFWFTFLLMVAVIVLAVFPWRLFFFFFGLVVVGPQNWALRLAKERSTTPRFILKFLEKRAKKREEKKKEQMERKYQSELPKDQPIISCHNSDNSPPEEKSHAEVDPREIHAVSVPYNQLMYHRMYDWPPDSQYAKCEPTVDVEERNKLRRVPSGTNNSRAVYATMATVAAASTLRKRAGTAERSTLSL